MTDEDLTELWNERAAIQQHDGKLPKEEAERRAYLELKRTHGRVPKEVLKQVQESMGRIRNGRTSE
jgi:hypothetical protein